MGKLSASAWRDAEGPLRPQIMTMSADNQMTLFEGISILQKPIRKRGPVSKQAIAKAVRRAAEDAAMSSLFEEEEENTLAPEEDSEEGFLREELDEEGQQAEHKAQETELAILSETATKYPLLSFEEEQRLFDICRNGKTEKERKDARQMLIYSNIRLVISVAKKQRKLNPKLPIDDMVDEGMLGLMRAIEKFEPERQLKFSTYAFQWIKQNITRAIANTGDMIRLPVHFSNNIQKISRLESSYRQDNNGEEASDEFLEKELDIPHDKLVKYRYAVKVTQSLDAEVTSPSDKARTVSYKDLLVDEQMPSPEDAFSQKIWSNRLLKIVKATLSPREQEIVGHMFGLWDKEELSADELAKKYSISKKRIRQIEECALTKLRMPIAAAQAM